VWNRSRKASVRRLALVAGGLLMSGCGGASKLEFYANEPGNFRVLVAGKPGQSERTLPSAAGPLKMTSMETVDRDRVRRVVVYTDLPRAIVESSDPDALLDGGIRGMSGKEQWAVEGQGPINLDGHPGREVRFAVNAPSASEKGAGKARIFLVGDRLYQAIMVGPASKVSEEELDHYVKSFELLQKAPKVASTAPVAPATKVASPIVVAQAAPPQAKPARPTPDAQEASPTIVARAAPPSAPTPTRAVRPSPTRTLSRRPARGTSPAPARAPASAENRVAQVDDVGPDPSKPAEVAIEASAPAGTVVERPEPRGNPREQFRELAPPRGVLVGIRIGYIRAGDSKVGAIQPIYQVGNTYIEGKQFGKDVPPALTVVARPGYAVGAINTRAGLMLDAFQVVFMRFKDGKLDAEDSYTTDWLGNPRGGNPGTASGEGKLVVGVYGRSNGREVNALGLLVAE
jgi:hypothetical protein